MTIGIYGGSFDPIHIGHQIVAGYVAQYTSVDEVWLMVSPMNPLKVGTNPVSPTNRYEMAVEVAADIKGVYASDFEFSRPIPSYTYDTLKALQATFPKHKFRIIIGSDNWLTFANWRNADKLIREFCPIIYPRPGFDIDVENLPNTCSYLKDAPKVEISSTFIRDALMRGEDLRFILNPKVSSYIDSNNLYRK
jgi:nicotinate-nucleotide adenylyltransferase